MPMIDRKTAVATATLTSLAVSFALSTRRIERSLAAAEAVSCVEKISRNSKTPPAPDSLSECVRAALPALVGSEMEPLAMNWLIDASRSSRYPQPVLQQRLYAILEAKPVVFELLRALALALPFLAAGTAAAIALSSRRREDSRALAGPAPRVLIIDDDPLFARTAGRILALRGFAVDVAGTLGEARQLVDRRSYDCVFCDYFLGNTTGTEVCESLFDPSARKRCVIISGAEAEEILGKERRDYEFLQKPCSGDQMVGLARRFTG